MNMHHRHTIYERLAHSNRNSLSEADYQGNARRLKSLREIDAYSISRTISHAQKIFIWLLLVVAAAATIFLATMMGWAVFVFFQDMISASEPANTKVSDFLRSGVDVLLVILSTLFLNYVITTKRRH